MPEENPLLLPFSNHHEAPPFDRIREEHFLPAIELLIGEAEEETARIAGSEEAPTFENTLLPLERNGMHLGVVTAILYNLNSAETNDELQRTARESSVLLTEYSNRLLMNRPLFERIDRVFKNQEMPGTNVLTPEEKTVLRNWYRDFVRNGALLEEKDRMRFAEIRSRLSVLSLKFSENVLAETNDFQLHLVDEEDLAGLPEYVREAAAHEAAGRQLDGWVFTLHGPSYVPFLRYSDRRDLRRQMATAYSVRGSQGNVYDNRELIREIVNLRLEQARLMGDPDYASYSLKETMAGTVSRVTEFLDTIHRTSRPAAMDELNEVSSFARGKGVDFELESWDWSYYAEKLRQDKYGFREELLKPYFELGRVIDGVFLLATKLYGLSFRPVDGLPVYHPDVRVYGVYGEDNEFLSLLYLDFFPRPGKQGGAWMTDFRGQSNMKGNSVRPHVSLVCNFSKPTPSKPSLLTHDEVNTFLHEFGHALHGMLSKCTFPSVSGTGVYHDFVELPSQLMENWAVEKEWLDLFAVHFETGEKIPADLIDRLVEAKNFLEGYSFERQLSFGYLDMAWHTLKEPFDGNPADLEMEAMESTRLFNRIPGSSVSTGFGHIFSGGYAAGYYGYKWAEALDADAFSLFAEKGIFNREVAASFRKNILEKGGSEPPMELYMRFRGQEPRPEALLERSGLLEESEA
jgi:peptidyl-dipeptidase Dcp